MLKIKSSKCNDVFIAQIKSNCSLFIPIQMNIRLLCCNGVIWCNELTRLFWPPPCWIINFIPMFVCSFFRDLKSEICTHASARSSSLWMSVSFFRVFLSFSENILAGLITGTDPDWRCMPLHMAAQIKMSPAACPSNSLALCPGLSQELQPDLSIWCSQHGAGQFIDTSPSLNSLSQ